MNKRIFLLALILILTGIGTFSYSQGKISGRVLSGKEKLEFATVSLADSSSGKFVRGVVTDKLGQYVIGGIPYGTYKAEASFFGFKRKQTFVRITKDEPNIRVDFELVAESQKLSEVVVSAKAKGMVGKDSFTFNKEQIRKAGVLQDLVFCLPEFKKDVRTGNIESAHGGAVPLILLNGIISSNEELKTIPPGKIIRIDRYDLPPERFNVTGPVIDIITAPLDNGYNGGFDANVAPLATDGYARVYYGYNVGNHRFNLFTSLFARDTKKGNEEKRSTSYKADRDYSFDYEGTNKFKNIETMLKLSYTYRKPAKYTFQASLSGNYDYFKGRMEFNNHAYHKSLDQDRKGWMKSRSKSFIPVLDLYFDYTFSANSRLYSNVVATANFVSQHMSETEKGLQTSTLYNDDFVDGDNDKASVIAQVEYTHGFKWFNMAFGTRAMYSHATFDIGGKSLGAKSTDRQKQFNDRSYVTLSGLLGKLQYYINPSFAVVNISAHEGRSLSETDYYFRPAMSLMYRFPKGHSLRLDLLGENGIPGLSQTSNVLRKTGERTYFRNNPGLKNSYTFNTSLQYKFIGKMFYIDSYISYLRIDKDIVSGFVKDVIDGKEAIVQQPENSRYMQKIEGKAGLTIKPLKDDRLSLRLYANPYNTTYKYNSGHEKSYFTFRSGGSVEYNIGGFSFNLGMTFPYKNLRIFFISDTKFSSDFGASYRYKSWGFNFSLENMFVKEKYTSENLPEILVKEISNTTVCDNYWKAGLGISFYFSSGKEFRSYKALENEDNDNVNL